MHLYCQNLSTTIVIQFSNPIPAKLSHFPIATAQAHKLKAFQNHFAKDNYQYLHHSSQIFQIPLSTLLFYKLPLLLFHLLLAYLERCRLKVECDSIFSRITLLSQILDHPQRI